MKINLKDNTITSSQGTTFHRNKIAALFQIADKGIKTLRQGHNNIIAFPHSFALSDDKIDDSPILSIHNTSNPDIVTIKTGNIMGFIGVDNIQVKISSRFANETNDYFLHYMLQKVFSFNIIDLEHTSDHEDTLDLLMFMFPYMLKNAMRQGIYREYQHYEHNDSKMKGPLNINRHIRNNPIFIGNIAYSTREYSLDNTITELIRHTIEFMRQKEHGKAILDIDSETAENVSSIIFNTPKYNKGDRNKIIQKCLRSKTHPYYTEYEPLQNLCMQILRMEEIKYGDSEDQIQGILFDGAWLWEEYVNTILCNHGFVHPKNKLGVGAIHLFRDERDGKIYNSGRRYPDFYKDGFVLDAKYKKLGNYDKVSMVERDDIHQVMAYMTVLSANRGGFVAPLNSAISIPPTSRIRNTNATMSIYGIEISKGCNSYAEFCNDMKLKEQAFLDCIL
jgi:5-methylcytosine-specific restriction endonuclease McrBC regulatory subunit McrC